MDKHIASICVLGCFLLMGGAVTPCNAQFSDFNLRKELARHDLSEVEKKVAEFAIEYDGSAEAVYVQAVLEHDAQKAMELYNRVKVEFPDSPLTAFANFQMGHYYFARGLYISARRFFLEVIEKHSDSKIVPDAMYFAAVCMCAARKTETCRTELENFRKQYRSSPLARLALEDLSEIGVAALPAEKLQRVVSASEGKYTLQLGSFSQTNNALNLRNYFSKLGFQVEIREIVTDGKTNYAVWLGAFRTKQAAQTFGDKLKKDHGKPYRIVSK